MAVADAGGRGARRGVRRGRREADLAPPNGPRRGGGALAAARGTLAAPVATTAVLALAFWLANVGARGFSFSPDSMSYAALARGLDGGQWFTSRILAWGTAAGQFRGEWPPFYPALVALGHALGLSLPWSEFVLSGLGFVAAAVLGLLAVQTAGAEVAWAAVPLLAGLPIGLYVAGYGWSEPLCLALLGLHYWLAALAVRAAGAGRPVAGLLFGQGCAAGLAFLDRYAAAAFLPAALALPLVLAACRQPAAREEGPRRGRREPAPAGWLLRASGAAALGVGLPVVPWTAACFALTGHVGSNYLEPGAGLRGALRMCALTLRQVGGWLLTAQASGLPSPGAALRLVLALAACAALGLALPLLGLRRRPSGPLLPRAVLGGMCAADALLSAALLIGWRARYLFDPLDPRLLAPSLYAAVLAGLVGLALVPWREARHLLVLPLSAVLLWHGLQWSLSAVMAPQIPAALAGPWCTPGADGDCGMMDWLALHTGGGDLIVGNASFTINFQLGRTTEDVETYPYNPNPTAADLRAWTAAWEAHQPGGRVFVVLDADTGPLDGSGPVMAALWAEPPPAVAGVAEALLASGPAYRIWLLTPTGAG